MKEKNIFRIKCAIKAEIRKCEELERTFPGKDGKEITIRYLSVKILDEDDNSSVLVDKDLEHKELYKRGATGTIIGVIEIDDTDWKSPKTKLIVKDFVPD